MKAVTIRVNDVEGVAGFVLPGDHVDVVLTRQAEDKTVAATDVVLQNVRVLAVDQIADERADKPSSPRRSRSRSTPSARRSSRSRSVGNLSLMLRKAGEANAGRDAPHHAQRSGGRVIQRAPRKRFSDLGVRERPAGIQPRADRGNAACPWSKQRGARYGCSGDGEGVSGEIDGHGKRPGMWGWGRNEQDNDAGGGSAARWLTGLRPP